MGQYTEKLRQIGPHPSWQLTPTADHQRRMQEEGEQGETFSTPGEANPQGHSIQDHGGPKIAEATLWLVWCGPPSLDRAQFEAFAKDLMTAGYFGPITPYVGGTPFVGRFGGSVDGPAISGTFADQDVLPYIQQLIAAGTVPQPDGKTIISLMLPSGVTSVSGSEQSCSSFCAYHSTDGAKILYDIEPATDCEGCHGDLTAFQGSCMTLSHEVAESVTDPYGTGWYEDATGMENSDIVAWIPLSYGPWTVQGYFGNENGGSNLCGQYAAQPGPKPDPQPKPDTTRYWQWLREVAIWGSKASEDARAIEIGVVRQQTDRFYPQGTERTIAIPPPPPTQLEWPGDSRDR